MKGKEGIADLYVKNWSNMQLSVGFTMSKILYISLMKLIFFRTVEQP